ncbi:MAG: DUF3526 domain-containing protein [Pseudomonadota bacterium]
MLDPIANAQWRVLLRDGRLKMLALATLLLTGIALAGGSARDARLASERAELTAEDAQIWTAQGSVNPHMAAHFGRYISKPVSPLTFFDPGVTDQLGTVARLEAHIQQPPRHRPSEGGGALSRFGGFSPALALQLLAPLLVILAGFSAFSGDRSRTILRQELASGAPRRSLLLGRYTALWRAILVILTPIFLVTFVVSIQADVQVLSASIAIAAGYLAYLLSWNGITLGVSALCRSARTSLVILLSIWLLSTFLVPRFANDVAARLAPTPTAAAFKAEIRAALEGGPSGHNSSDERLESFKQATLERYGVERIEDLPVSWSGLALQEGERIGTEIGNAQYEKLWRSYAQQQDIRRYFSVVSPLLALKSWSSGLSRSDASAHVDFVRALEDYRFSFVTLLNEDIATNAVGQDPWSYKAPDELLHSIPPFDYTPPAVSDSLRRIWPDGATLALWAALAFGIAVFTARRVKPL